jgi:hypothetical protein
LIIRFVFALSRTENTEYIREEKELGVVQVSVVLSSCSDSEDVEQKIEEQELGL